MTNAIKKLKQDEKKVVVAYAKLKLKSNRLSKELDTMKQSIVNVFDRTNQMSSKEENKKNSADFSAERNEFFMRQSASKKLTWNINIV